MLMLIFDSLSIAMWILSQSWRSTFPSRSLLISTLDSMESILIPRDSSDISRLKIKTFASAFLAAFRAMLRAKALFPMPGRAARITRSDFCRPLVILSISA